MQNTTLFPASRTIPTFFSTVRPYVMLFAAHLITAQTAFYIYQGIAPAVLWPSAGIALAGLILGGRDLWPAITIASLTNSVLIGQSGVLALSIAMASTFQAYIGAYFLEYFDFDKYFSRLRDGVSFIAVSLAAGATGPLIVIPILLITEYIPYESVLGSFGRWWLAASAAFVIVGSVIIRWSFKPMYEARYRWDIIEGIVALIAVCVAAFMLAWTPYNQVFGISLVYLMLGPFFWIAFRIGPRGMTLALLLMTFIFLTGVTWGWGTSDNPLWERIVSAQTLSLVLSIIFLLLVTANEERKEATKSFAGQVGQLENIIKKIRAEEQVKTEFLAILAHELRNPLAPILSSIELLKYKGDSELERSKILASMEERIATMGRLLDDLLDISRITRKKLKLHKEVVDVREVAESSIESVRPLFESKQHALHIALPRAPLYMNVDSVRIEQIMVNLLTNAAKYTNDRGEIMFSLRKVGNEMELRVKDNGVGIPQNIKKLIFEPFIQLPQSTKRGASSGLGIGLSLTKRLVDLHRGSVEVESRGRDKGSEFTVRIPIDHAMQTPMFKAVPKEIREKSPSPLPQNPHPMRILVVDDNEAAAEGIEELLRIKGYEVAVAYNGKDALKAADRFHPEAMVLDIGLPDMSGHEVARTLRSSGSKAFLIALTGYGQEEDKIQAEKAGFNFHLTKPVGIDELQRVLNRAV